LRAIFAAPQEWDWQRAVPASMGLHLLAFAAVIAWPVAKTLSPPPPRSIAVEIISEAAFAAVTRRPVVAPPQPALTAPEQPAAAPSAPAEAPPNPPKADETAPADAAAFSPTLHATVLYSSKVLKDPANRQVRIALPTLSPDERITQLCNIEALEQIRIARPSPFPDALVAPALAETNIHEATLVATGAAFRSGRAWFKAQYTCTVGADLESVTAFDFALGPPIPEAEWDSHGLNAADAEE
jgi:hypothetical protein